MTDSDINMDSYNDSDLDMDSHSTLSVQSWEDEPYGQFSYSEKWTQDVFNYDHPASTRPRCACCLSREGELCSCHGAFYCSQQHRLQDHVHTNGTACRDGTDARRRVEALVPILAEVRERGLEPFDPLPPAPTDDPDAPEFMASTDYHDALVDWCRALLRMPAGTAIRKAFEVHAQLNSDLFMDRSYFSDHVDFEDFKENLLPILQSRTGREMRSWASTANWSYSKAAWAMANQTGVEMDPFYTDETTPDLIHPLERIFEPTVMSWFDHELEALVSHFLLKLKALLALETVEKARILSRKEVRNGRGDVNLFPFELIRLVQEEAATPLLLWSREFNRLFRKGKSFKGMIQKLRCHVSALACHIHENNEAFWPFFMHPELYIKDMDMDNYDPFSDRWNVQEVLQLYFPAFAETPGAIKWILENAIPCQFSHNHIQQRFWYRAWGNYP